MAEVCAERGAANVTVAHVVERAGVSRRTFYELFTDREDCFLAAFDEGLARIAARVLPAWHGGGSWRGRIRASLIELLLFLDNDPVTGRLVIVDTLGAGHRALERRGHVLAQVISAVDEGRRESKRGDGPPPLTVEGVLGGVLSVLYTRLAEGSPLRFVELAGPLMSMIVLPYMGAGAARRELERPLPPPDTTGPRLPGDPLRDLGMRLTYRTVRVLLSVAARPGSSNRQIGVASGVTDQGQISKLLSRLERFGLIENTGLAPGQGAPNAWTLTEKGSHVEQLMNGGERTAP